MLVVGRVEIGQVEVPERRRQLDGVTLDGAARAVEQLGHPQLERVERARRPLLHVRHLHAGGRVDPVGRLDEARQEQRVQRGAGELGLDGVAHGVDPGGVVRLEEAGLAAEHLGHVALGARPAR